MDIKPFGLSPKKLKSVGLSTIEKRDKSNLKTDRYSSENKNSKDKAAIKQVKK